MDRRRDQLHGDALDDGGAVHRDGAGGQGGGRWRRARRPSRRSPAATVVGLLVVLGAAVSASLAGAESRVAVDATYSNPALNDSYQSGTLLTDDPWGMGFLYDVGKTFIKTIAKKDAIPPGLLRVENGTKVVVAGPEPVPTLLRHYAGVLGVLAVGLLVIVLVPIVGMFNCCCSCCCCCCPSKKAEGGVGILAQAILAIIAIILLLGAGFALASNQFISNGIRPIAKEARVWRADVRLYLKNTKTEVDALLQTNYIELSEGLVAVLENASDKTNAKVNEVVERLPLDDLTDTLEGLKMIQTELQQIQSDGNEIMDQSQTLTADFTAVRDDIQSAVDQLGANCPPELLALQEEISKTEVLLPEVPNVQTDISEVSKYTTVTFEKDLTEGRAQVDNLQNDIKKQLASTVGNIKQSISETGVTLRDKSTELTNNLESPIEDILARLDPDHNQDLSDALDVGVLRYDKYRYYAFLAVALILLLVSALVVVGLLTGLCCKGTLSVVSFKLASALIYLTASVLMLATMLLFVSGFTAETFVCQTLRHPGEGELFSLVDELVPVSLPNSTTNETRKISSIITGCRQNGAVYDVFGLDDVIDIDSVHAYADDFKFDDFLQEVKKRVNQLAKVPVLPDDVKTQLESLRDSPLSTLDVALFRTVISTCNEVLSHLTPSKWASQLEEIEKNAAIDLSTTISKLNESASIVHHLQNDVLVRLEESVGMIDVNIKLNSTSFAAAIQGLMDKMTATGEYVHSQAPEFYQLAEDTANKFKSLVTAYLDHVVSYTKTEAAKCGPLGGIYDSITATTCDKIVNPLNGFWISAGWCVILFVPTLFILSCS